MSGQRHIIKRHVFEFHTPNHDQSQMLYAELSRICRQKLVPMIDRHCTALTAPDEIHRIDTLEIDLGTIDAANFEETLISRLETEFAAALKTALQRHPMNERRSRRTASHLELLTVFARSGTLPWWADASQSDLLHETLTSLMHNSLSSLRSLLSEMRMDEIHRLVNHYPDKTLNDLVMVLSASAVSFKPASFIIALQSGGLPSHHTRRVLWSHALKLAISERTVTSNPTDFYSRLFVLAAATLDVPYSHLLSILKEYIAQNQGITGDLASILKMVIPKADLPAFPGVSLAQHLEACERRGGDAASLWMALRLLVPYLSQGQQNRLLTAVKNLAIHAAAALEQIMAVVRPILTDVHLTAPDLQRWLQALQQHHLLAQHSAAMTEIDERSRAVALIYRMVAGAAHSPAGSSPDEMGQVDGESPVLNTYLEACEGRGGDAASLWMALRLLVPYLSQGQQNRLLTAVKNLPTHAAAALEQITAVVRPVLTDVHLTASDLQRWLQALQQHHLLAPHSADMTEIDERSRAVALIYRMVAGAAHSPAGSSPDEMGQVNGESSVLNTYLEACERRGGDAASLWMALRLLGPYLSQGQQNRLLTAVKNLPTHAVALEQITAVVRPILTDVHLTVSDLQRWLQALQQHLLAPHSADMTEIDERGRAVALIYRMIADVSPDKVPDSDINESHLMNLRLSQTDTSPELDHINIPRIDLSFSQANDLYIDNAGLVILWIFLSHFFTQLDLLTEHRFKSSAAQKRAVALLQHLVSGQTEFPEYKLPLNKVLCGMPLDDVFELDAPLSDTEIAESTQLLMAVIEQAAILHSMPIDGLRGTFLLRQGRLSRRDGVWLLQVERETYDIVLERFPWTWEWLKLPWMEAPLRVEW